MVVYVIIISRKDNVKQRRAREVKWQDLVKSKTTRKRGDIKKDIIFYRYRLFFLYISFSRFAIDIDI